MAEILFDSKDSKVLVDSDSGNYAVRKNDTIIATDPGIANKAFEAMKNVVKNAKTGLTHIFDVGSRKVSQMDHEGNPVAQRKMSLNEVGKFSSFLANVGKNIEKGLSKLGKGGKVALVVAAMLATAAMSQQLQAANYVKGGTMADVMKLAKANPGKCYLAEFENIRGATIAMMYNDGSNEAKNNLNEVVAAGTFDPNNPPTTTKNITYGVVSDLFQDFLEESDVTVRVIKETAGKEGSAQNEDTSIKVAPHLEYKGYKIDAKTAGYYNQDNKFVSFTKEEVKELQKCYDETFDAIKKGEIKLPAGMTGQSYASLMTSSLAAKMASEKEKENVLVVSRAENTNTKAKEAEKYLKDKGYIGR